MKKRKKIAPFYVLDFFSHHRFVNFVRFVCVRVYVCVSVSNMPSISLSVHNVFLDAKRVYASVHFTEDHKLVEIMKDQFFSAIQRQLRGIHGGVTVLTKV